MHGYGTEHARNESLKAKHWTGSECVEAELGETSLPVTSPILDKTLHPSSGDMTKNPYTNPRLPSKDICSKNGRSLDSRPRLEKMHDSGAERVFIKASEPKNHVDHVESSLEVIRKNGSHYKREGTSKAVFNGVASEEPTPTPKTAKKSSAKKFKHLRTGGKRNSPSLKKSYLLRSSASSERVLRSRSREKPKEPASRSNLAEASSKRVVGQRKRRARKKKGEERKDDGYSRIRKNLRYLLNRINYEQSLITAYSSEGWKGLSLEKLKPEQELQRATKEILRRKLKIRDLFQHLDALSAEGRLPESLFDSEGEIDGEDIFCARCGSKDLSADNDIILCDGVCDRGFHQYCLEPPLLKDDIPPDDEGWLCPGCDCKVDCFDLLNDSLGTNLSINDSWEKVVPEAAVAAAAGGVQDPNFGLPSDDSNDDDYDPDSPDDSDDDDDDDGKDQEDESSDESDFTSASDEMVGPSKDERYMGLPSDDSEDDDFDPDALVGDEKDKKESSISDFTSDSEDPGAVVQDDGSYQKDEVPLPGDSSGRKSQFHGRKKQFVNDGLSVPEPDPGQDGFPDVPKRRSIEKLDYKKLYDETYGNVPSSSSDDEDWADRKKPTREGHTAPTGENATENESGTNTERLEQSPKVNIRTCMRKSSRTPEDKNALHERSAKSSGERSGSSAHRYGESVTQRLHKAFQENRYPNKSTKESLAGELKMTYQQVDNWFRKRRCKLSSNGTLVRSVSKDDITETAPTECQNETAAAGCSRDARNVERSRQKSATPKSRKRKRR